MRARAAKAAECFMRHPSQQAFAHVASMFRFSPVTSCQNGDNWRFLRGSNVSSLIEALFKHTRNPGRQAYEIATISSS